MKFQGIFRVYFRISNFEKWKHCNTGRNTIPDRHNTHWNSAHGTDYEDARWSLENGNNSASTLNSISNLLTNWWWIHKVNFPQWCIANAKWMAFANWKVVFFYMVNGAALELHFARKSYVSGIMLRFWAPENTEISRGVYSHINIDNLRLFFECILWNIDV